MFIIIFLIFSPQLKIINRRPVLQSKPPPFGPNKLFSSEPEAGSDACSVYKVSMNQELFYQYVEYEKALPDLKEFTLCMWSKFHNHSDDHPLFSYAGKSEICIFVCSII